MALTEIAIKALKPTNKEQKVYDAGGLYLAISPSGAKTWRLKYRVLGKEKKLTLGVYPALTLKEARFKRDEARKHIADGGDPAVEKKSRKRLAAFNAANTFKAIAEEWHENNKAKWTQRHGEVLMRRLELHIFPAFGDRPIKDIKPLEILETLRKIEKRDATHLAHRLLQICASIDWKAKEWHLPEENTKMRDAHIVPLSEQAISLLQELKTHTGWSPYLFPTQQRQKNLVMSENTVNVIIKRMGYEGQIVGHGFRALASTILNEQGFKPDVIERQLAHAERNKVRAAYNRAEYLPQRREMMQWWGSLLPL